MSLDLQFIQSPQQYQNNVDFFKSSILPQLKPQSAIIINGSPSLGKQSLQELWYQLPQTQHNLLSFDTHLIPGSRTFIVSCSLRVRFDESGKSRLGDSADLVSNPNRMDQNQNLNKSIWGNWYGVVLNLVIDEEFANNMDSECINSFNYRFTYKPDSAVVDF